MRTLTAAAALLVLAAPAPAQHERHGASGAMPAGWQSRVDRESRKLLRGV